MKKDDLEIDDLDIEENNEDIVEEIEIDPDDYGFDEEDFEVKKTSGKRAKNGRRKPIMPFIIIGVVVIVGIFLVIRLSIWNKGVQSDYNPDEDTSEYDVEPTDYIQPLSAEQLAGKTDDGVTTILTLGNSPFSDNYDDNNLAKAIAKEYNATVINGGFDESYITLKNATYDSEYEEDGVSLVNVINALVTGDFSIVRDGASQVSDTAIRACEILEGLDMSSVDAIFIMYNLEDYQDHRPLGSEDKEDVTCIYGALYSSIKAIQEKYPYIRIVMLSQPAGGVTIDNFYVDGDKYDIGCGTLSDYVTFETQAVASRGASFIDVYYGAINVDNRDEYLYDDYHINDAGAEAIAKRVKKLVTLQ